MTSQFDDGKAYTQLDNLNILDTLRIQGGLLEGRADYVLVKTVSDFPTPVANASAITSIIAATAITTSIKVIAPTTTELSAFPTVTLIRIHQRCGTGVRRGYVQIVCP